MKIDENAAFVTFDNKAIGQLFDDSKHPKYPIRYYNVVDGLGIEPIANASYYGFVYDGTATLITENRPCAELKDGMYFSVSGKFILHPKVEGRVVVIEVLHEEGIYPETNYSAVYHIGGPLEPKGRLKYIDGCTDSLLIPPVKLGDPCLNHLHFPTMIDQTQHTHPSHRIGLVTSGHGKCITPFGNMDLVKGMIFIIKEWNGEGYSIGLDGETYPNGQHAFETRESVMNVIAVHPDSDFGATDVMHPMINRTIVDGVSANQLEDIRTK